MMAVFHDKIPGDLARKPNLMLQEYHDQDLNPCIQVYLPYNLRSEEFIKLFPKTKDSCAAFSFPALNDWVSKTLSNLQSQDDPSHPFHKHPYVLKEIDVQAVDWFWRDVPGKEDKLGFMKIQSKIETEPYIHDGEKEEKADWLPGAVFLRGGSVAVILIVQPEDASGDDEKQVIFTIQPRLAVGSLAVTEIPAGMLDGNSLKGAAASELEEEAGLKVNESDLINMSELAAETEEGSSETQENQTDNLERAMYPSPGACDEFIPLFLCQKRLTRRHMSWLSGKATGLRDEGERITLKLVPLEKAWRVGAQDGKALAALALYEGLKREGKLGEMPTETEKEPVDVRDAQDAQ